MSIKTHSNMSSVQDYLNNLKKDRNGGAPLDILKQVNEIPDKWSDAEMSDAKQKLDTYKMMVAPINKEIADMQYKIWEQERRGV